ncbi:MAG: 3-dehydroquinate synthase [Phycisphaerae bacterium]|nr:3-dehydroquinate synthase [Phycisphaerae bacterium]
MTDVSRLELDLSPAGHRSVMLVGRGLLAQAGDLVEAEAGRAAGDRIHLVIDRGPNDVVSTHHGAVVEASLRGGGPVSIGLVTATESNKSLATVERGWSDLAEAGVDRRGIVVGIGGGIVCDLAGFVAAGWMRGIGLVLVPTTLLSMVDAGLGGKTGVNRPLPGGGLGKNLVGAFWPARLVLCDTDTLETLGPREYRAGLAECVKHGIIEGEETLAALEADLPGVLGRDPEVLPRFVARSASVKAAVVHRDFREGGERALLNLGHTYAHAIESRTEFGLLHGEAVSIGLIAAATAAASIGLSSPGLADRISRLLARCGLPTRLPGPISEPESLLKALRGAMQLDKKSSGGRLRLVLPAAPGDCRVIEDPDESAVMNGWRAVLGELR